MQFFTQLITSFCASCVFMGALFILCPEGALKKPVKYLLGLVFIISVTASAGITVRRANFDFTPPESEFYDETELKTAGAEYVYAYALEASGINFKKITVLTNKAEDGSIIINKIVINSDCERGKILEALGEAAKNYEVETVHE